MLLLDVTVVNVALPAIRADLDASFAELQWVVDAYALTLAATLLTAGALADRHGRRAVFAAGLVVFTACSALCAAAGSGARARPRPRGAGHRGRGDVRRLAGAARERVPGRGARLRARRLGRDHGRRARRSARSSAGCSWTARAGAGCSWSTFRSASLLTWLTLRSLPESRDPSPRGLDLPGLVSFGAASFLGTLGLIRGNEDGWTSAAGRSARWPRRRCCSPLRRGRAPRACADARAGAVPHPRLHRHRRRRVRAVRRAVPAVPVPRRLPPGGPRLLGDRDRAPAAAADARAASRSRRSRGG